MPSPPEVTVEQWSQALRAKQPPSELRQFIEREYPEAIQAAAARGASLDPSSLLPVNSIRFLRQSKIFRLYFSWSKAFDHQTWTCITALGPEGLVRLSGRPHALSQVLRYDAPPLSGGDAEALAELLAAALLPEGPPDSMDLGHPYREARMRSTLLTSYHLSQIDSDPRSNLVPIDTAAWQALRPQLAAPSLELVPGGGVARFCYLDGTSTPANQGALFRVLRFRCPMEAGSYTIHEQHEELGQLGFHMPVQPVPGRPLHVDGQPRRSTLQRRSW